MISVRERDRKKSSMVIRKAKADNEEPSVSRHTYLARLGEKSRHGEGEEVPERGGHALRQLEHGEEGGSAPAQLQAVQKLQEQRLEFLQAQPRATRQAIC